MKPAQHLAEFEREMDMLNFVFGAALGGYVGIIMASEDLPRSEMWILVILLAGIAAFLLTVREVAKALVGLPYLGLKFPWNVVLALTTTALVQLIALSIPVAGEKFTIFFRGWIAIIALYLGIAYLRKKKWKQ